MATRADIQADLVLEIDGTHVTPEKFLGGVRTFFAILSEVTAHVSGKGQPVVWRVQVRQGSNLVEVVPEPGFSPGLVTQITDAVSSGIAGIEDEARVPDHFSERALRNLRDLAKLVGDTGEDDTAIRVWGKGEPIQVTHSAVTNVSEILAVEHEDFGSLEGRLETLSGRKGLHFVIYERLRDQAVRCLIASDELLQQAMANFQKRVEVYGVIKYRKDGKPISIRVEEIVAFPPAEKVPSFRDVHGILRKAS